MTDVLMLRTHGVSGSLIDVALEAFGTSDARNEQRPWQSVRDAVDAAPGPYSYGLAKALRGQGWSVEDVVLDLAPLREAWVGEHGPLERGLSHRTALAFAAIERFRPGIVIDLNLKAFDLESLLLMRRRFPFVQGTVGLATGLKRLHLAAAHDIVLVPGQSWLSDIAKIRPRSWHPPALFHHAFNPELAMRSAQTFAQRVPGTIVTCRVGGVRYRERTRIIERLLELGLVEGWLNEQLTDVDHPHVPEGGRTGASQRWRNAFLRPVPDRALSTIVRRTGKGVGELGRRMAVQTEDVGRFSARWDAPDLMRRFPARVHPPVHGHEMFDLLGRSTSVLHHGIAEASSLRHFEATGMGAALVTNMFSGLEDLFEIGTEVLAYRTEDEAVELIRRLRSEPGLAAQVGSAGQQRTLTEHTPARRAMELGEILRSAMG